MGLGSLGATLALDLIGGALGMIAVFVMQSNFVEGYLMGGMTLVLACYVLWQLEWQLPYALRVGVFKSEGQAGMHSKEKAIPRAG